MKNRTVFPGKSPGPRPLITPITAMGFPKPKEQQLTNGLKVYVVEGGAPPVFKMEIQFLSGRPFEQKRLAAGAMAAIIREGTQKRSAASIAREVDHVGATLSTSFSFDHIGIQLVCLARHATNLLPLVGEIITQPLFDPTELQLYQKRSIQRLLVDLSHNDVVAYRKATEQYFGTNHPYGYNSTLEDYQEIKREHLEEHYHRTIGPASSVVILSGHIPIDFLSLLEKVLGSWNHLVNSQPKFPVGDSFPPHLIVENMQKPQSAVRIGKRLFNRQHPDWPALFVLNTILGGYFGSRLMKNLREDKGLTYGVHASLESLRYDGYLSISFETDKSKVKKAIRQIQREMESLQQDPVPEMELNMVKNYLGGYFLSLMDGPLQMAEVLKNNLAEENSWDFTDQLMREVHQITASGLLTAAQKYLNPDSMSQVIIY